MVYNTPTFNKDLMNPSHPVVKKDSKPMPAYDFHLKKKEIIKFLFETHISVSILILR